jgi:hypothetical protein
VARRADVLKFTAGASCGSGFAIAANRALTSLRAVGTVVDGALALHQNSIDVSVELTDSDGENDVVNYPVYTCTVDDVLDFDRELDWIVFDVDSSVFAGMAQPVLGAMLASDAEGSWTSYGFPDAGADTGAVADGVVTSLAADVRIADTTVTAIQLRSHAAAAAEGGPASGFLGAPVMVGRHVIGVVCAATATAGGEPTEGAVFAIPLTALAQRLKLTLDPRGQVSEAPSEAPTPAVAPRMIRKSRPPKVAGPLARLRTRFRDAQPQIALFAQYAVLHHVLQQLELPFHAVVRERGRLAASRGAWSELRDPLDALHRVLIQAIGLLGDRKLSEEFADARQRLSSAAEALQIAIAGDAAALDGALLLVRRVLARDLSSANNRMRGALRELGLGDVVAPLRTALDNLPRDDTSDPRLDELPPLVTNLEALHARLDALVRDHDAWHGIDSELGFFADAGRQALDDAQHAWPVLRASLDAAMLRVDGARWAEAIAGARAQLHGDLSRRTRASARLASLRALWRACHLHFVEIHREVVRTCEELARVSTTLAGVLDGMKQIDG